ncbi:hypothetical protein [Neobacillus sp.]|uniref:hypothetical protein n=1 Tax=Neobacillus sp. TaxID=2675273 RepID=UPI0035B5276E
MDIKTTLIEEFENDPIYKMAILNGLEEYLFTEGILSMHIESSYSTVEAGKIIDRSDSTIRNHFRSDLIEYIAPERFGKYYRLNYQSIFRLHMIFLLMEKANKTTVDLLVELGMQPTTSISGNIKRISRDNKNINNDLLPEVGEVDLAKEVSDRFIALEYNMSLQRYMLNILKYEKDIADIERKIDSKRSDIKAIESEFQLKFLEEKQSQLLASALKEKLNKKPSFFSFMKKKENEDIIQIEARIQENLKTKYELEKEAKIRQYVEEISKLEQDKEKILALLENENKEFQQFQLKQNEQNLIGTTE